MQLKNHIKIGIILSLFVLLVGCTLPSTSNENKDSANTVIKATNKVEAKVVRVVDGDTIQVSLDGKEESVRLLLVDTPETKHPNLPKQPFGQRASDFAKEMLEDKNIQLEFDGPKRDKYDRLLAYIWVDEKLFNELLLEEGLARYAYEYDPPYIHQDRLRQAAAHARSNQTGIWSIEDYVSDEGFQQVDIEPKQDTSKKDTYSNCAEARQANVTPLFKNDVGYSKQLDRDGDGIACE